MGIFTVEKLRSWKPCLKSSTLQRVKNQSEHEHTMYRIMMADTNPTPNPAIKRPATKRPRAVEAV
jgi:hypothetical protein